MATDRWHVDESYIKVRGHGIYVYRAIDSAGDTVEFFFSEPRDLLSAERFALDRLQSDFS
jgi:putative transposase